MLTTEFGDLIAERMRAEHRGLASRWFARLVDLLPVAARDVFPTDSLLDHIPALILEISDYLREPTDAAIVANTAILDKARELGALRHAQKASLHQVLREYQLLSGVLVAFVLEEMERVAGNSVAAESVRVVSRLHQAVDVLAQATTEAFVTLYTQTIAEQRRRLEQFTRMAAHEWRQPLGALQFGVQLLARAGLDDERAKRTLVNVERSVAHLVQLTTKLEAIARVNHAVDSPVIQVLSLTTIANEAARQLREMAEARGVAIQISETLPAMTVDVGRLELVFVNLLSNAIKYSDPGKTTRFVEVSAAPDDAGWHRIIVRDNGVGIPKSALATIFQRFTRAHTERNDLANVGGVGLGLSIVEDCVRDMGGRLEVESVEDVGTTFAVVLPTRAGS